MERKYIHGQKLKEEKEDEKRIVDRKEKRRRKEGNVE